MFYAYSKEKKVKIAAFTALFLLCTLYIYPQSEMAQRGSIPEELLRPRRDEAPRYPKDMVIGTLGRGQAPQEAYDIARNAAAAFLAGNMNASVFSPVSKSFVESCMSMLNAIHPQYYRIGSGREEPDGSVSFLVRFVGREQGITGELFVRFEERQPAPPPAVSETETSPEGETVSEVEAILETEASPEAAPEENAFTEQTVEPPSPAQNVVVQKRWLLEDLILEEARSREDENRDDLHRYDFAPYERIY